MNGYFDDVEQGLKDIARRRRHLPWYTRIARTRRSRAVVVVIAALVVATPAVAAVSGLFSIGNPYAARAQTPTAGDGAPSPGQSRMLALRVSDPAGGPKWGLRMVPTSRGDICLQPGRVKDNEVGALGVDNIWHNDHKFHEIPAGEIARSDSCATTDAAGYARAGFYDEENISADLGFGPSTSGCRPQANNGSDLRPVCPAGTDRLIFYGLLGPGVKSIGYHTPDGRTKTELTQGKMGAYLLVFRRTSRACLAYFGLSANVAGACTGGGGGFGGRWGPYTKVTYTNGDVCHTAETDCLQAGASRSPARVHASETRSPLHIRFLPKTVDRDAFRRCHRKPHSSSVCHTTSQVVTPVKFSVTARKAVTSSRSWYEWMLEPSSPGKGCGGDTGTVTNRDIKPGAVLHFSHAFAAKCHGPIRAYVVYAADEQSSGPHGDLGPLRRGAHLKHGYFIVADRTFRVP